MTFAVVTIIWFSTMSAAAEMNVRGVVTIAGGPCGAQPVGGRVCVSEDVAGEGVRLTFIAKAGSAAGVTVTAGPGGRFAARLAAGVHEVRLASGQAGALRLDRRTVRVPAKGTLTVNLRLDALRP